MVDRTERQKQGVQKWVDNRLKGTLVWPTGVGKTNGGLMAIQRFQAKNPTKKVIIVVPSDPIKLQWMQELAKRHLKAEVVTMNKASTDKYECCLLVIDEIHKIAAPTLLKAFDNIKYTVILGLTATFSRVDGRDSLISQHAPIVDTITLREAVDNHWLSKYVEYKVMIDPDDIEDYRIINQEFQEHFAYFDHNFEDAMKCNTDWKYRYAFCKNRVERANPLDTCTQIQEKTKELNREVSYHAMRFGQLLTKRKKYIQDHPKKLEVANYILAHRQNKKCITFSSTIAMAEKIKYGKAYSGKDTAKKGRMTLDEFKELKTGTLNTVSKLNEGFNDPSISVGIILGFNSSQTASKQRLGRVIRLSESGETKEVFHLVLRGTQDEIWCSKALAGRPYTTINEDGLHSLLEGGELIEIADRQVHMMFTA